MLQLAGSSALGGAWEGRNKAAQAGMRLWSQPLATGQPWETHVLEDRAPRLAVLRRTHILIHGSVRSRSLWWLETKVS